MELKALPPHVLIYIAKTLNIPMHGMVATITLLDEGATVPFIARYRKEVTGNLDEVQIRDTQEKLEYFRELEDRRATVLDSINEQGKLTPELKTKIESVLDKSELEDLYLPYKPKRRTKATIARDKGLEPLAKAIWDQQEPVTGLAAAFVDAEKGVANEDDAFEGARHIIAEWINEDANYRKGLRQMMAEQGVVVSHAIEGKVDPEEKFKMYADYSEPVSKIPSHRMLAIRRGANEEFLSFEIELEQAKAFEYLKARVIKAQGDWTPHLLEAVEDSYKRLLNPSIQTEIRLELKDRSDEEAIRVFKQNLENLLLAPPAGVIGTIGIDPGIRTGCKIAVVDDTGKFLEHTVIYPLEPKNDIVGSIRTLSGLITKYNVKAISIGNGTGSRETAAIVQDFLRQSTHKEILCVVVNESGASVYSASDIARQEFPELDLTVRGAISIARRLQDPLAELVKIDPKSIGVGQYQHDVDQRRLKQGLEGTVESCVNRVGVDLNTASWALLRYVAGISERTALHIVEYRNQHGRFKSRLEVKAVSGFGPKTFEQAAGFLRIRGGDNPLDMTAVHPESYPVVEKIAESLGVSIPDLIAKPELVEKVDIEGFKSATVGIYTLTDIREELRKPGRDPRDKFVAAKFRDDVHEIKDLTAGMVLEGVVTNVTKFGAFVDIGVHQDGLVHISELSVKYIKEPSEAVKAGQIVKVQVLSADPKLKRIALSIKALQAPVTSAVKGAGGASGGPRPQPQQGQRPQQYSQPPQQQKAKPQPTMEDKLAALSNKFRTR